MSRNPKKYNVSKSQVKRFQRKIADQYLKQKQQKSKRGVYHETT